MNIGIVYHLDEANDAAHAWEVFQNEVTSQRIPFQEKGKTKLQIGPITFWLIEPSKDNKWLRKRFRTLFVTNKAKKKYPEVAYQIRAAEAVLLLPYPTQGIVDYVREVEHLKDTELAMYEAEPVLVQQTIEDYLAI